MTGPFVAIGLSVATVVPGARVKRPPRSWYAVTDRRAVVCSASLWGTAGAATDCGPEPLRKMVAEPARSPKGAGDLICRKDVSGCARWRR